MSERLLDRRWPWLVAGGGIVLALVATMIRIPSFRDWDSRPLGSVEDIEALRGRDDLNLMFVLIDTLRAEHLGSYGYERDTSPVLDRMAASGVRFARHLAQSSWTKTSMASLWTGLNPARVGITRFDEVLPDQAVMPAETLREHGFQTIGLWRNGWVSPSFGFAQGFDVYKRPAPMKLPPGVRRENPTLTDGGTDEAVVLAAMEFLRVRGDERWFLYLHLMDVHEYVYDEESALFGSNYSDIYDNSIRWTDGVMEALFGSLADLGHLEDTLVVVASDHGEAFGERGFEGHARKVYREETEVPFLISFPFRLEPGVVVETRTRNIDAWPTIFDLLGLETSASDGRSRVPEILASVRGEPVSDAREPAIAHLDQSWARPGDPPQPTVALSEGSLRFVRVEQPTGVVEQLYDASEDPRELRDIARKEPEAVDRLSAQVDAYLELRPDWGESPTREINEMELNHLRALGYVIP